jgi:plasmid stabilization system protein ParE
MTSRAVEFHEEASLESAAATEWYLERSEMAASRFVTELKRAIALIAEAPQRWPTGVHGTRKFLLKRFPFSVVYREFPSKIQVVAVAHGHRRPGYWKNRF